MSIDSNVVAPVCIQLFTNRAPPTHAQHDLSTFVTIPYFHQVHWTLESMQQHRPFNATAVLANKRHWAAHAYAVRPIWHKASDNAIHSRIYLYQQCVAAGKQACSFVKSEARDWAAVFR